MLSRVRPFTAGTVACAALGSIGSAEVPGSTGWALRSPSLPPWRLAAAISFAARRPPTQGSPPPLQSSYGLTLNEIEKEPSASRHGSRRSPGTEQQQREHTDEHGEELGHAWVITFGVVCDLRLSGFQAAS